MQPVCLWETLANLGVYCKIGALARLTDLVLYWAMLIRLIIDPDLPAVLEAYRQSEDFLALGPNPYASPEMIAADRELSREQGGEYCGLFKKKAR